MPLYSFYHSLKGSRGKGLGLLHVMLGYSLFTCAFFTGRLADDTNYVSGFQILILVSTFLPAGPHWRIYQYFIISILLFFGLRIDL